jgi:hypothetical protein
VAPCQAGLFQEERLQEELFPGGLFPAALCLVGRSKVGRFERSFCMGRVVVAAIIMAIASPVWADEAPSQPSSKGSVRVQDLPKPIPELLEKIQRLSTKIEPEISRLGSTLGQELKTTVKKLCEELQCQDRPEPK